MSVDASVAPRRQPTGRYRVFHSTASHRERARIRAARRVNRGSGSRIEHTAAAQSRTPRPFHHRKDTMTKTLLAALAATLTGLLATAPVHAATDAQKKAAVEKWQEKTPEEKAAAEAKIKAKYDAMTPEQKKEFAAKHPKAAAKFDAENAASAPAAK